MFNQKLMNEIHCITKIYCIQLTSLNQKPSISFFRLNINFSLLCIIDACSKLIAISRLPELLQSIANFYIRSFQLGFSYNNYFYKRKESRLREVRLIVKNNILTIIGGYTLIQNSLFCFFNNL